MTKSSISSQFGARAALVCVAILGLVGCVDILARMSGAYTGPLPSEHPLVGEVVIVREIGPEYEGRAFLIVERASYAEAGDPHNVDRVIKIATTPATEGFLTTLAVRTGDILEISTDFSGFAEASGSMGVRNWPGHKAVEYPIGSHLLTVVSRHP